MYIFILFIYNSLLEDLRGKRSGYPGPSRAAPETNYDYESSQLLACGTRFLHALFARVSCTRLLHAARDIARAAACRSILRNTPLLL